MAFGWKFGFHKILWIGSILNTQRRVLRNGSQFRKVISRNGLDYAFTSPEVANCLLTYNGFREPLAEMSWESIPYWAKLDISPTTGQVMGRQLPNSSTYTAKYTYYTAAAGHRAGRLATSSTWTYPSNAALGTTTYDYNERGQILSITGNGTTPSAYAYDAAGRTTTLTTWRGAAGDAATAQVTTWTYSTHPTLPLLRSKKYPGRPIGIDYTYAADGSLATRDWERPDGTNRLRTTYSTNNFGQTTGVTYSNAAVTPPVAFAYDRAGRVRYRTDAAGTTLLEYRYDGTPLTETTVSAPNNDTPLAAGRHLRRTVDTFGRLTGFESAWGSTLGAVNVAGNGTVSPYVTYSYGTADRLSGIAFGGMTGSIVHTSTAEAFQVTPQLNSFSQDYAYNRILRSTTTGQPSNHLAYVSGLGNLRNSNLTWDSDRLTSRGETDMNWNYAYDRKGQVAQAFKKFTASNSNVVVSGTQSQYNYDGIGNRTTLDEGGNGTTSSTAQPDWTQGLRQTIYTADALNQYTQIQRPQTFDVSGKRSSTNATITINDPTPASTPPQNIADYQGLYFRKEMANTPAGAGDLFEPVQVKEGTTVLTPDPDPVQYVGAPSTGPTYDVDGNLLTDGRWTYSWDGENRLISMTAPVWTQPAGGFLGGQTTLDAITLSFRYDGLSRRISKKVTTTKNGVVTSTMEGYLYDGWNPVMITKLDPAASSETVLTRKWSCLWRPDVGSSLYARSSWQKAGGVGGLAWMQTGAAQTLASDNLFSLQGTGEIHIPMADHMGNIRNYIHARATTVNDGSGPYAMVNYTPSASFEYDAFGREVRANGTTVAPNPPAPAPPITPPGLTAGTSYADALPFHFSSKFTDPESGLNYYGYRFYDAKDGRWLSRDPIAERGGANIYGFVENNPNNQYDINGRFFNIIGGLVSVGLGYGISVVSGQDYSIGEGLVDFAFGAAGPGLIGKVKDAYKACKAVKYEAKYVQVIIKSQTRAFDPITGANLGTHLEKSVAREWSLRVTAGEVLWETSGLAVYHTGKYFVKDHIKNDTQTIDKLDAVIEHTVHPNGETKTNYKISTEKSENPIGAEKDTGGSIDLNRPLD